MFIVDYFTLYYFWQFEAILIYGYPCYSICDYWLFFYWGYWWLLMAIFRYFIIGYNGYSIIGYWWLF